MNQLNEFSSRLKFVRYTDIIQLIPMFFSFIFAFGFKLKHSNVWLVCERRREARDNGYCFFKYLCEKHPEIEAVYAIDKNSPDYNKVKNFGKVIQFGSFIHWVYYWTAKRNISSQKEGKPNAALCFILEVYLGFRKNRAFIMHGICKDDQKWLYYSITKMNLFTCSAQREYEFVKKNFGYPETNVQLTGLCRYDFLLREHAIKRQILIMPTMRIWLKCISSDTLKYEKSKEFIESEYYVVWNSLIKNEYLSKILDEYDMELLFYPHASMQQYVDNFSSSNKRIVIADDRYYDVQSLLMESAVLITDYSSIYFDFAYMEKPLIYYQFDYKKYRCGQYQEGYFSYQDDGFGCVVFKEDELLKQLEDILAGGIKMNEIYRKRVRNFFAYHDTNNCLRTYNAISCMKSK